MIFVIFFIFQVKSKILKIQKNRDFLEIGRKSSFGDPISLNHLVSENIGSGGHFGVFTTQIAHFFTKLGSAEVAIQITKKY